FVGAKPEAINSTIKVINLQQCIKYEDAENVVKMAGAQNDTKFTIDSSDCGNIAVSIELCRQNQNCAGGAEGGITVTPLSFTLTKDNASKEISVGRQSIAGMYGINVEAKVPGTSFREVNNIDVLIEPAAKTDFSLEKYELNIKGIGAKDEAMLSNSALAEQVSVDASACDWGTAEEEGMFDLAGAGMGAAIAALLGAKTAIGAASKGAQAINFAKTAELTDALGKMNAAKNATDAASTTSTAVETYTKATQNTAVKKADAAVVAAQSAASAGRLPYCGIGAVNTALATAQTNTAKADVIANGTLLTNVSKLALDIASAVGNAVLGVANTVTGQNTASPNSTGSVSTGPINSMKDLDKSITGTSSAITDTGGNLTSLTESQSANGNILAMENAANIALEDATGAIAAVVTACETSCGTGAPPCCGCSAEATAAQTAITNAQTAVSEATAATNQSQTNVATAISDGTAAKSALETSKGALITAKESMGSLGNTMAATGAASSFSTGK
ncbi:MAG: hypothetical protein Q8N60_01745, partial [Candidatus Diapherotrites archaeon]|nr:hypothetical protein [Candidatus Diapherotrites archaeon]